jgi:N-formylglutamate amidohydrolase
MNQKLVTTAYRIGMKDFVLTVDPLTGPAAVTISIPHDTLGNQTFGKLVPARLGGVQVRDRAVWAMARDVAAEAQVNLVRGLLPRAICDYNRARPPGISYSRYEAHDGTPAYDLDAVGPFWQAYHGAIWERLRLARERGLTPLLLDFHGFTRPSPLGHFDVILGTGNRSSVNTDVDRQLGEHLRGCGYTVFVPETEPVVPGQDDYMDAEHTTLSVGKNGLADAIQVEIFRDFRVAGAEGRGRQLASDLAVFIARYAGGS